MASIEDSGDGPLDEELDEITKVHMCKCNRRYIQASFQFLLILECWCEDYGVNKSVGEGQRGCADNE